MMPSYSLSAQLDLTTRLGKSGALPTADRGGDGTVSRGKAAANFASGAINDPVSEGMSNLTSKSGELMSAADRGAGASA
jgi:hypothetical protein